MKTLAILALGLFAIQQVVRADDDNSGESFEARQRKNSCGHLCDEPDNDSGEVSNPTPATPATSAPGGSGSGSGAPPPGHCVCTPPEGSGSGSGGHHFHSHCILVEAFYNLSITLTIEQQEVFIVWIQHIEDTILADFELTSEQKFIKIAYSLKAFFVIHYDIKIAIGYEFIAGWGKIVDILTVSIDINADFAESLIVLDENDDCELFEALRNATAGDSEKESACEILITEIRKILISVTFTYEEKCTKIFSIFESFFEEHSDWESFFLSIEIKGFGSLEEYIDVVHVYWRITNVKIVIGGDAESCELIKVLEEASGNTSFSVSVRTQIGQLRSKLLAFFQTETDVFIRLQYVSAQCYQFFKLAQFIEKFTSRCSLGSVWKGDIFELIFCATFYHNHGWNHGGQTTGAVGTTAASEGSCSERGQLITIVQSTNSTVFTDSINTAYNLFSRTDKANFASYKKRIEGCIWGSEFSTVTAKLTQITTILTGYAPAGSEQETEVMAIQIQKWGTVQHFCDCESS